MRSLFLSLEKKTSNCEFDQNLRKQRMPGIPKLLDAYFGLKMHSGEFMAQNNNSLGLPRNWKE